MTYPNSLKYQNGLVSNFMLSGSYVDTLIRLHNKPEIKITCWILCVSASLTIFELLLKFYCQTWVGETLTDK